MNHVSGALDRLGRAVLADVEEMGKIFLLFISVLAWMFRPPLKLRNIFKQMEFVGVKSIFLVVLTGTFTGMVMALQGTTVSICSAPRASSEARWPSG